MGSTDLERDVPYGEDLQSEVGAAAWVLSADQKRPWRAAFRELIAEHVVKGDCRRVVELGSGPGLLARCVLERCPAIREYVLVDFSEPMLAMAREKLAEFSVARFLLADFRADSWIIQASPPFDSIFAMQSVHEVRHKRHVPLLYSRVRRLAAPEATIFVCDHTPENDSWPAAALYMTEQEQLNALIGAGFKNAAVMKSQNGLALYRAQNDA